MPADNAISRPPDTMKQKSAFPPNFVHSLDSAHMMYTAKACGDDGVTFVSVHDSYWTHAATVDSMSAHCREQFVHLHSQPLLPRLYEYMKLYHNGTVFTKHGTEQEVAIPPPPARGDFDLVEVTRSKYFFN